MKVDRIATLAIGLWASWLDRYVKGMMVDGDPSIFCVEEDPE